MTLVLFRHPDEGHSLSPPFKVRARRQCGTLADVRMPSVLSISVQPDRSLVRVVGSGARSDRAGRDADPGSLTLLVRVRVQSFLVRSIGEHGVSGAAVDQSNLVIEDADLDVVHSEILEGPRLGDEFEELGTVAGDTRSLRDEVFGEELAEALDIVELVGMDVVLVELVEDRHISGGLFGLVHFLVPSLCSSAFASV